MCKCGKSWTGESRCHCASCHQTFSNVTHFDKHRKSYKCVDPQSVGLELNERNIWTRPGTKEDD